MTRLPLHHRLLVVLALALAALPVHAAGDVWVVGPDLRLDGPVDGDVWGTAGGVAIDKPVAGDVTVAGGEVGIAAPIGGKVRVAAGHVDLDAAVVGDLVIAAGEVVFGEQAAVGGRTWIAAGDVELAGRVRGPAKIYAGNVRLAGEIDGDVIVRADSVELAPTAHVRGRLYTTSVSAVVRADGARVDGGVVQGVVADEIVVVDARELWTGAGVVWLLVLLAAGAFWTLAFPGTARAAQARLARAPGTSIAVGVATLLLTPLAAVLLAITIVGLPVAAALLLGVAFVLLAGTFVVGGWFADQLLKLARKEHTANAALRLAALAVVLGALCALAMLPSWGWLLVVVAVLAGTGALVGRRFMPAPPP